MGVIFLRSASFSFLPDFLLGAKTKVGFLLFSVRFFIILLCFGGM